MSKNSDSKNISDESQDESEVILMLKKMQQHLSFLEKKIDTLVDNSSQGQGRFSRPSRDGQSGGYRGGQSSGGYRGGQSSGGYRGGQSSGGYRGGQSSGGYSGGRGGSSDGNGYSSDRSSGRSGSYDRPSRGGQDQGFGDRKKRPFRAKKDNR